MKKEKTYNELIDDVKRRIKPENMARRIVDLERQLKKAQYNYTDMQKQYNEYAQKYVNADKEVTRLNNLLKYNRKTPLTLQILELSQECDSCSQYNYGACEACTDELPECCKLDVKRRTMQVLSYEITTNKEYFLPHTGYILSFVDLEGNDDVAYVDSVIDVSTGKELCDLWDLESEDENEDDIDSGNEP